LAAKVTRSSASELDRSNIARAFATSGLVLKRAQGVYVEDEKGKKYLDMTAGGTTAVGYSHPRLTKALVSQVSRGIDHIDRQTMITEKASELTDELKRLLTCIGRLEPDRQRMMLLAYYGAFSRQQLAAKLDMPVDLLRASLRRSLLEIERCLKS